MKKYLNTQITMRVWQWWLCLIILGFVASCVSGKIDNRLKEFEKQKTGEIYE